MGAPIISCWSSWLYWLSCLDEILLKPLKVVLNLLSPLLVSVLSSVCWMASASLAKFVENTGSIEHHWRGLGTPCTITWDLLSDTLLLITGVDRQRAVMLAIKNWHTWRRYLRDIRHLFTTGLLIKWCCDNNGNKEFQFRRNSCSCSCWFRRLLTQTWWKPTFDDLLNAPSSSPYDLTHMNYDEPNQYEPDKNLLDKFS